MWLEDAGAGGIDCTCMVRGIHCPTVFEMITATDHRQLSRISITTVARRSCHKVVEQHHHSLSVLSVA